MSEFDLIRRLQEIICAPGARYRPQCVLGIGDDGTLWLIAGTDSAFEGLTQYYIVSLTARLEPYEPE